LTLLGAWRGTGLVPFDPEKLLRYYDEKGKGVPAGKRFVGNSKAMSLVKRWPRSL
jgi:hypothetical protein